MHSAAYGGSIIAGKYPKPQRRDGNGLCPNSVATLVPILTLVVLCRNRGRKSRQFYTCKIHILAINPLNTE